MSGELQAGTWAPVRWIKRSRWRKAIAYVQAITAGWGCNPNNPDLDGPLGGRAPVEPGAIGSPSIARRRACSRGWVACCWTRRLQRRQHHVGTAPALYDEPWGADPAGLGGRLADAGTGCARSALHVRGVANRRPAWRVGRGEHAGVYRQGRPVRDVANATRYRNGHGEPNNLLGTTPAVGDTVTDATYTADVDAWLATLGI